MLTSVSGFEEAQERFKALAKSSKGQSASRLVNEIISSPYIFNFSELAQLSNIKELNEDPNYKCVYKTLELFCFHNYNDYKESEKDQLLELNKDQLKKLKQLTLIDMASKEKSISYSLLLQSLDLGSIRELEDLIIDAIYIGVFSGKLDQKAQLFHVASTISRDVQTNDVPLLNERFLSQVNQCDNILELIEDKTNEIKGKRITQSDQKQIHLEQLKELREEVQDLKESPRTLRNRGVTPGSRNSHFVEKRKKTSKN